MNTVSTIIAVIFIAALLAGIVIYIWKTRDQDVPNYKKEIKVKPTKEEKAAAKAAKKAEKPAKASKKSK